MAVPTKYDQDNYSYFTKYWTENVAPTGTFYKHPDAVWPTGIDGIPEGWTVVDAEI